MAIVIHMQTVHRILMEHMRNASVHTRARKYAGFSLKTRNFLIMCRQRRNSFNPPNIVIMQEQYCPPLKINSMGHGGHVTRNCSSKTSCANAWERCISSRIRDSTNAWKYTLTNTCSLMLMRLSNGAITSSAPMYLWASPKVSSAVFQLYHWFWWVFY